MARKKPTVVERYRLTVRDRSSYEVVMQEVGTLDELKEVFDIAFGEGAHLAPHHTHIFSDGERSLRAHVSRPATSEA